MLIKRRKNGDGQPLMTQGIIIRSYVPVTGLADVAMSADPYLSCDCRICV